MMFIYHITRTDGGGDYDEYDSAVVAANNPEEAIKVLPEYPDSWQTSTFDDEYNEIVYQPKITVKYIGVAAPDIEEPQCIVASFNAG